MAKHGKNGKRTDLFMIDPDDLVIIDDPKHHLYDQRAALALDESMVLNIMAYGVIEPVTVAREGDQTVVVDGRRRVLHAREAKKRQAKAGEITVTVPCAVKRGTPGRLLGISRSANNFRVTDGPMTNALSAQRMLDLGQTEEEVAATFGIESTTLKNIWLKLLDLDASIQRAVEKGEISTTAAARLAQFAPAEQKATMATMRESGEVTIAKTNAVLRAKKGKTTTTAPSKGVMRKLIKQASEPETHANGLDNQFLDGVRFAIGELSPKKIKGLTAALSECGYKAKDE